MITGKASVASFEADVKTAGSDPVPRSAFEPDTAEQRDFYATAYFPAGLHRQGIHDLSLTMLNDGPHTVWFPRLKLMRKEVSKTLFF